MNIFTKLIIVIILAITISCKSKPIESQDLIGRWDVIKRWGKGSMSGSIIFESDGACETIKLPWGSITGNEQDLAKLESVKGDWRFIVKNGMKVIEVNLGNSRTAGFSTTIDPKLLGGKWTFRQYIGDPDTMDIIEFQKMPTGNR